MSVSMESLGIDKLTREDRLILIGEIWDSLTTEGPLPLTEAQKAELHRRNAEYEADPDSGIPWEEVKRGIDARLRKRREGV